MWHSISASGLLEVPLASSETECLLADVYTLLWVARLFDLNAPTEPSAQFKKTLNTGNGYHEKYRLRTFLMGTELSLKSRGMLNQCNHRNKHSQTIAVHHLSVHPYLCGLSHLSVPLKGL
jgi:hypothetical protein